MILDDICNLFHELNKKHTCKEISTNFGRNDRKFALNVKNGCNFVLNAEFVAGLNCYGYQLKLVKKECEPIE